MKKVCLFLPFLLLGLSACQAPSPKEGLSLYATCYPIYDFICKVAGEKATVTNLVPPSSEPHEYEPTPKEFGRMSESDALFYNGLGMESWIDSLLKNPSSKEARALAKKSHCLSEGIDVLKIEGIDDPHIWLDPQNAIKEMETIKDVLVSIDEKNASTYRLNFENEAKKLEALDQEATAAFSALENKNIVVAHAAFGYMAEAYGLTQHYVSGLSPDEEPTAQAMEKLIETVKETKVHAIYTEELFPSKIADKLAQQTGCQVKLLYTLESLSQEQLSAKEDYLTLYRKNIQTIQEGAV